MILTRKKEYFMIKKMAIVLISTVIGTSLYAGNDDAATKGFLGLEVGAATVNGDRSDGFNHNGNAVEYGVRLGAQNDKWRATFTLDYYNSNSDDQKMQKGYGLVDYFLMGSDSMVRPFVGVNVGYAHYESTLVDANGFLYGGQAGVVVAVGTNIDLDLSYRYSLMQVNAVNDTGSIVFGFNYVY
jgi:outer membrane protein W